MKFSKKLVALCVFHPNILEGTAFTIHSNARASSFLKATPPGKSNVPGGVEPPPSVDQIRTKALEARLNRLEKGKSYAANKSISPNAMFDTTAEPVLVQGANTLRTWSFADPNVQRVKIVMDTEGRPLDSDIELWQGPDNTPHKMRVYVEDGALRPFTTVIETPRDPSTVAIRNTGNLEFPLSATVVADTTGAAPSGDRRAGTIIQGGALKTFPFDPRINTVKVLLKTDGRPLNSRIELLQGPNNNKQVIELYTEDGLDRPFYTEVETPGSGNVVRVVNTATMEFPLTAWVDGI